MTTIVDNKSFRELLLGRQVKKSITTANGIVTLFNITGGRILLTSLAGRVTTLIGSTTSNLKITYNPTAAGTSFDLCTAVDVATDAVENTYTLLSTATIGSPGALVVAGTVGQAQPVVQSPFLLQAGALEANFSADPVGGVIEWTMTYVSYDDAATVAAA